MAIEIGERPAQLSGCWSSWQEQDVDTVLRTDMDSGAVHTRRRFTGVSRLVTASVTLKAALYQDFMDWYRITQRQGAIATRVVTPYGAEEVFQWAGPPNISWPDTKAFTASVSMYQGSWFA